ncbi:DUF2125 domain-containing protein [Phenylobacterium sp. J426]|uniref:DUF2125 domain-containing protein n=1 Tax=Phenylobacterium sp. J426 TaxID=2898439 RepID=UPI00215162DF|nr:DUF2125 domain-containing protein [Phenylobacterium sp. J426]MCR5874652.1 DUF2125 domain-containing protein [Phenylobacterium sp. J426]
MSLHDLPPPRKRRLGLVIPWLLAILVAVGWTGGWIWLRGEARDRMDESVETLRQAGYDISWKTRGIRGYPFRLSVVLEEPRIREPSGWGLEAPRLEADARISSPSSWIIAAPQGLTFVRPVGGPVRVEGKVIRASLTHPAEVPPRLSFEGADLRFQPGAGAQPFGLETAKKVEFHLRGNKEVDEGLVSFRVDEGRARLSGLLGRIAGERPVSIVWNATLTRISAFNGETWADAVRRWVSAGGRMTLREAGVTAGEAVLGANRGTFTVGPDGRLSGVMDVTLRQGPRALGAMGETGVIPQERADAAAAVAAARAGTGDVANATLNFQAGQTTLGPVALGPAPKVYELR